MSNEKKISLYLRGDNKHLIKERAKKEKRKTNDVINIAIEEYLNKRTS